MVGPIEKIPTQANSYSHTGSSIKIYGWSGVRFSVRFPVFVLLMVVSMYFLYIKISFVLLIFLVPHLYGGRTLVLGQDFSIRVATLSLINPQSEAYTFSKG